MRKELIQKIKDAAKLYESNVISNCNTMDINEADEYFEKIKAEIHNEITSIITQAVHDEVNAGLNVDADEVILLGKKMVFETANNIRQGLLDKI